MFLYIIPFENLDQFILKFGFIYLATKLNVLSSIDATRWKLDFNPLRNHFTSLSSYDGLHRTGGIILKIVFFLDGIPSDGILKVDF